jgi:signal peptidase I
VLVGLVLFRALVLDWNVVPTGSMKPTILEGDYIVVNKLAYGLRLPFCTGAVFAWSAPKRGDVVVFEPPGQDVRYVKRVVGLPGDRLAMRDNELFVNGKPASYEDLDPAQVEELRQAIRAGWLGREVVGGHAHPILLQPGRGGPESFGELEVPAGRYFVMGDNRDDSKDSRSFGFVPRERIVGRVSSVAVSLDPDHHNQPRWNRFFHSLA